MITSSATSSGGTIRTSYEATSSVLSGATGVISVNVPIGAKVLGCQLNVDLAITSGDGGTTWSAAAVAGITSVYKLGGAQAIAAFAYGTHQNPVDILNGTIKLKRDHTAETLLLFFGQFMLRMIRTYPSYPAQLCAIPRCHRDWQPSR